jgi:hypothetical protein
VHDAVHGLPANSTVGQKREKMVDFNIWLVLFPVAALLAFPFRKLKKWWVYLPIVTSFIAAEIYLEWSFGNETEKPGFDDSAGTMLVFPLLVFPFFVFLFLLLIRSMWFFLKSAGSIFYKSSDAQQVGAADANSGRR